MATHPIKGQSLRRTRKRGGDGKGLARGLLFSLAFLNSNMGALAQTESNPTPLMVTNSCPDTIWPGIKTGDGKVGPATGGFVLAPGETAQLWVGWDWQGRVWGRTNCSFNANGTGPDELSGINGAGAACMTGDCFGGVDCGGSTGQVPATLAEFNLNGNDGHDQVFYDISLVDGYNLPMGIVYIPSPNLTWIPPNLSNPVCIATAGFLAAPSRTGYTYTNSTYPMPYETTQTNSNLGGWCPWDLQKYPPSKPGDGVYPYPDDNIKRPTFDPCLSQCSYSNSPQDCCVADYNTPGTCNSDSLYSQAAKAVCPDAYSFAFNDQTSTFTLPAGGGFQVVFCPEGRSTNILATFGPEVQSLSRVHDVDPETIIAMARNITYIKTHPSGVGLTRPTGLVVLLAVMLLGFVLNA